MTSIRIFHKTDGDMRRLLSWIFALLLTATSARAGEWNVHGRVVDKAGQPVTGACVASFWLGNGKRLHADGTPMVLGNQEDMPTYWQHIGEMEPVDADHSAVTDSAGRFTFALGENKHLLLVMDRPRKQGAIVFVPKGKEEQLLDVCLVPLVRVRGKFTCSKPANHHIGRLPMYGFQTIQIVLWIIHVWPSAARTKADLNVITARKIQFRHVRRKWRKRGQKSVCNQRLCSN